MFPSEAVQWFFSSWNDVLTVFTFILTSAIGFYKIRDYRREIANIVVHDVTDTWYRTEEKGAVQSFAHTELTFTIDVFNKGREPAYIVDGWLDLQPLDGRLECYSDFDKMKGEFGRIELGPRERKNVELRASELSSIPDSEELRGEIHLKTSTGRISKKVTFE